MSTLASSLSSTRQWAFQKRTSQCKLRIRQLRDWAPMTCQPKNNQCTINVPWKWNRPMQCQTARCTFASLKIHYGHAWILETIIRTERRSLQATLKIIHNKYQWNKILARSPFSMTFWIMLCRQLRRHRPRPIITCQIRAPHRKTTITNHERCLYKASAYSPCQEIMAAITWRSIGESQKNNPSSTTSGGPRVN